jgi:hypothetical protein
MAEFIAKTEQNGKIKSAEKFEINENGKNTLGLSTQNRKILTLGILSRNEGYLVKKRKMNENERKTN